MKVAERSIGFAIVGAGAIAAFHARAIASTKYAELRAVNNRSPTKARAFAYEYGCQVFDSLDELLGQADIDAVCITAPSGAHGDIALRALAAGKHVLCEKPLEITTARIDAMIAAAERADRVLAVVFQYRLGRGASLLRQAIMQGRFGRLALSSAFVRWWREPEYYRSSNWKGTAEWDGGGALMNQAVHAIDLLQWLIGMPVRVSGCVGTRVHTVKMEDTAAAWLKFPDGSLGVIEAATSCYPGAALRIEISGEKGSVVLEDDKIVKWAFADSRPEDQQIHEASESRIGGGAGDPMSIPGEGHRKLVGDFVEAIRLGRAPLIPSREARNAVAIIEAIYESSRAETIVRI